MPALFARKKSLDVDAPERKRAALLDERTALVAAHEHAAAAQRERCRLASFDVQTRLEALREAQKTEFEAKAALQTMTHQFDRRVAQVERALVAVTPDVIPAFLDRIATELARIARLGIQTRAVSAKSVNIATAQASREWTNNYEGVAAVQKQLAGIRRAAEQLRFEPCDDLPAALEALWATVPFARLEEFPEDPQAA